MTVNEKDAASVEGLYCLIDSREFALTALLAHCDSASNNVTCLDAFAATGKLLYIIILKICLGRKTFHNIYPPLLF